MDLRHSDIVRYMLLRSIYEINIIHYIFEDIHMATYSLQASSATLGRTAENKAVTGEFDTVELAQTFVNEWVQALNRTAYSNATDWTALPVNPQ